MNLMSLLVNWVSWGPFPIDITKMTMKSVMMMARAAVPTVESTPCNPIFAKIATRAANKAESAARINHSIPNHLTFIETIILLFLTNHTGAFFHVS